MYQSIRGHRHYRGWLHYVTPAPIRRLFTWLYWDVWWSSWLSYRMTSNPRTVYLLALALAAGAIAGGRR